MYYLAYNHYVWQNTNFDDNLCIHLILPLGQTNNKLVHETWVDTFPAGWHCDSLTYLKEIVFVTKQSSCDACWYSSFHSLANNEIKRYVIRSFQFKLFPVFSTDSLSSVDTKTICSTSNSFLKIINHLLTLFLPRGVLRPRTSFHDAVLRRLKVFKKNILPCLLKIGCIEVQPCSMTYCDVICWILILVCSERGARYLYYGTS